jgi:hypothetical protein
MRKDIEKLLKFVPQLRKRFRSARRRYRALARQAKRAVVRWEWCTDARYSHNPFGPERFNGRRGRVLSKAPEKKPYKYRYGFSSDGRVIVEEQYTEFKGQKSETFWEYAAGQIDSTLFHHTHKNWVLNVESTFLEDGMARGFILYGEGGMRVEAYEYRDGLLVCVHEAGRDHDPRSPRHALSFMDEHLIYRNDGLVKIVRKWKSGARETVKIAADRTTMVDLRRDARKVEDYVRTQVVKWRKKATAAVKRIQLGFGYGDSNFVALHFDTRANSAPDGEWAKHIQENELEMPLWNKILQAWGDKPLRLILPNGTERHVTESDNCNEKALAALFGEMLKGVLLSARAEGAFEELRKAEHCELGVEELEGNYGWPRYEDRGKENLA